jgi:histidine triad (HIT) family protein
MIQAAGIALIKTIGLWSAVSTRSFLMPYDSNNIFAKILRDEIPCKRVYENEYAFAFHDINPKAPTHILIVPKGPYVAHEDFVAKATDAEIAGFERTVAHIAKLTGVDTTGYRLISNSGANAHQEVPHYHVHILGGRALGPMLSGG